VIIGVRADGHKEPVALADGFRESAESWADLLRDCGRRGMRAPVLAVGDGALGFWKALRELFPQTKEQRCWFHVGGNVLAALPKSAHPGAKAALAEIYNAEDRDHALKAVKAFEADYGAKWPKATSKITDHLDVLLAFYATLPSTGSTCARPTRSSRPSPPCGSDSGSPRAQAQGPPGSRCPSSSCVSTGPLACRARTPPRRSRPRRRDIPEGQGRRTTRIRRRSASRVTHRSTGLDYSSLETLRPRNQLPR
jgi:putative transposase